MNSLTVPFFMVVLIAGLAPMALHIFQVNAWNVGTVKVAPWSSRASAAVRSLAVSFLGRLGQFMRSPYGVAACVGLLIVAWQSGVVDAAALSVIGLAGTVAEPTLAEVKTAIENSNRLFQNDFKEVNEKIKALEAKGAAVDPLLLEHRNKLNEAIEAQSAINEKFIAMQTTVNRLEKMGLGDTLEGRDRLEAETRAFNIERRAVALSSGAPAPATAVTTDEYKAYTKAFDRYLRVGEKGLTPDEARAMTVGSDLNGGFLVTPDRTGRIVKKIFETSDVRRYASVQPISTDALEGSADLDEASGGWVGETGSRSETNTPAVPTPWKIPVHEVYANPKASQKLINDASVDVGAWLEKKVGDKLTRLQNVAFVTGVGVAKPRGYASYTTAATADASRAWGTPEHVATGSNGSFGTDPNAIQKLNSLMGKLKDAYVAGSAFYMNRLTKFAIRNLTDASSAGKFVFIPSFQAGVPDVVLGAPVRTMQDMADYTTTDALAIAYGDMAEFYQIVDRQGLSVLVDPYTAKPYVHFYTTARVGGDVVHFEAMKFLKFGTS
jgi:HK97 family phage major capsid protein